ncbi:hypothetical protein JCM11491_004444 [Sporobolomyces phaffii]
MHPSVRVCVKPVALSSIPRHSLRLAPAASPSARAANSESSSPTLAKLLANLARPRRSPTAGSYSSSSPSTSSSSSSSSEPLLPEDGRGLANAAVGVPKNLRVEEWVPKRTEFHGVSKRHRDLLRRLRREA